jgi:hypothetical protein
MEHSYFWHKKWLTIDVYREDFCCPSPLAEAFLTGTPDPAAAAAFKKQPLDWLRQPHGPTNTKHTSGFC